MVKSKFPGKPSRLVQRTLVSAFSVTVPSCDTSTIAENVCYGLSVFENTFGNDDDDSDFVGFSDEEIKSSLVKKAKLLCDAREKFSARGLTYSPSSLNKKHYAVSQRIAKEEKDKSSEIRLIIAVQPEISPKFPNDPKKERRKCGKIWLVTKKMGNQCHPKIPFRHNFKTLKKNGFLRFKHKSLSSNYLSDKFRKKFCVPSRSLHSSRLIKPTKRFVDSEKRDQKTKRLLKNDECDKNDEHDVTISDEKARLEVSSSKVIIREARLNITTEPAITGPFSAKKNMPGSSINNSNRETTRKETLAEKEHFILRGPRIKHVCRSASSVLRTSRENSNECDTDDSMNGSPPVELSKILQRNGNADVKSDKGSQLNRVRQCNDNNVISIDNQNDNELSQHQGARCLQDFHKESSDESEEREDKLIDTDFWEAYDPDEICKTGFPLISSEPLDVRALCFLCGSAGMEKLLYCVACCEPYHWYCAEGPSAFREELELEKYRANWICRKCKVCSTCGKGGDVRTLSSCKRCRNSYHIECLSNKASNKRLFKSDRPWVCPSCLRCKSCNSNTVCTHIGNIPLCSQCFKLRQKGNYCPLCQGCYQDEDYNVQMMECGICKCWIHAKCEGISYEKYQILSFLPDSIEFVCRLCCSVPPAQWWLAVEDELKAGFYGVLKSLCNNKKIGDLLKESPRKEVSPCTCSKRDGEAANVVITDIEQKLSSPVAHCKRALSFEANNADLEPKNKSSTVGGDESVSVTPLQKCSLCYCNGVKIRNGISERLLAVKANVRANQYASVFSFNQQVENVLAELEEGSSESIGKYREILKQFFPWFDAEHAAQHEDVLNNSVETFGSKEKDAFSLSRNEDSSVPEEDEYAELRKRISADEYKYETFRLLDVRRCNLCKGKGEAIASEGGRLIYCGRNEWVHSNCALWSSEVFEEIDGSLQNVHSAISRGRQIRCSTCDKKGASVGCCYKNCALTYHFSCAKQAKCVFLQNKTIYCNGHDLKENNLQLLVNEKDFEILRPVYIEMDRKKKKLECHTNVRLRIGSLHVESLGRIDPHLSDQPQHILPMNFRCTRLFWSTRRPWKIVQYHIQIKVSYTCQEENEADVNYTVDHSVNASNVTDKSSLGDHSSLVHNATKISPQKPTLSSTNDNKNSVDLLKNKGKRKPEFDDSSNSEKKVRENGYLSAAKLGHVVIDYRKPYPFEKLVQLDGMIDIYAEEEPVTCAQCHRTYRTTFSYERHLETCNSDFSDFMISSCESDSVSSEEDKISAFGSNTKMTSSLETSPITEMAPVDVTHFADKYVDAYIVENNDKLTTPMPTYASNVTTNVDMNATTLYPCAAMTYEDAQLMNSAHSLSNAAVTLVPNVKRTDTIGVLAGHQPITLPPTISAEPTIKFNLIDDCGKITNYSTQLAPQSYNIQNVTSTPTYVIHQPQYQKPPMPEMFSTFLAVDNTTQPLQQIHLQSLAQPFQHTVVPTILGHAIVQPNIIETTTPTTTYIVNAGSASAVDLYGAPSQNVILPSPQPLLFGMETMVSNTVMSSSHHQFVAQSLGGGANIGSSTLYSTTTTQVFQAAKQLPPQPADLPSGYILLNSPAVSQTPASIQTIQPSPAALQEVQQRVEAPSQQVAVVSGTPARYMYVQINSNNCSGDLSQAVAPAKKLPPVIVKPAVKPLLPDKRNTKVMKVKNNRPIAIQTADNVIPLAASNVNETAKGMTTADTMVQVKNLKIKTTDKAVLCRSAAPDASKATKNALLYSGGGEATGTEGSFQIKCAPAAVNGRSMVGLSCLSINAPKAAKVADCAPLPSPSTSVSGVTHAAAEGLNQQAKEDLRVDLPNANVATVADLIGKNALVANSSTIVNDLAPKQTTAQKTNESSLTILTKEKTTTVLNGKKTEDSNLSVSLSVSPLPVEPRKENTPIFVNGKKIRARISPHVPKESVPVVLNERNVEGQDTLSINLTKIIATEVVDEKKSAPSMPLLDLQLDDTSAKNKENSMGLQSVATSTLARTVAEPVRRKYTSKVATCKSPEVVTLPQNMPLLEPLPKPIAISETDRIFDELVRQHKLSLEKKAAAAKEKTLQSSTKNTTPHLKLRNETAKPEVAEKVDVQITKKASPDAKEEEGERSAAENKSWKTASISYEVKAEDGFTYKTNDLHDLWNKILESVQQSRNECKLPLLPKNALVNAESVYSLLGLENNASKYLLEQLPDAWKCIFYKPVFHKTQLYGKASSPVENVSGSARTEPFTSSHKFDMFGWLASRHRKPPKFMMVSDSDIVNGNRRITSLNLPMAMRFRHLKETAKETVGVFRSDIHGRGLFCLRDIDAGEMVIEYAGEVIRSALTDKREKYYTSKGIGCYMFRIDDSYVVDATMYGNAARFINHSCDPNCYSRIVDILGKKHILIFALRRILKGEELTYDYKFPLEEDKIHCHCLARKCRKYLN